MHVNCDIRAHFAASGRRKVGRVEVPSIRDVCESGVVLAVWLGNTMQAGLAVSFACDATRKEKRLGQRRNSL
jgi:hypothetical protein